MSQAIQRADDNAGAWKRFCLAWLSAGCGASLADCLRACSCLLADYGSRLRPSSVGRARPLSDLRQAFQAQCRIETLRDAPDSPRAVHCAWAGFKRFPSNSPSAIPLSRPAADVLQFAGRYTIGRTWRNGGQAKRRRRWRGLVRASQRRSLSRRRGRCRRMRLKICLGLCWCARWA